MCTHHETQFSASVNGQRLTFDVRPHDGGGHTVALFNHAFPTLPIVFHTPNTDTLDEAVAAAAAAVGVFAAETDQEAAGFTLDGEWYWVVADAPAVLAVG